MCCFTVALDNGFFCTTASRGSDSNDSEMSTEASCSLLYAPNLSLPLMLQQTMTNHRSALTEWVDESVSKAEILRLIYQGRFLHGNVTLGALGLPAGKTCVMHLVPRENLPEPNSQGKMLADNCFSGWLAKWSCVMLSKWCFCWRCETKVTIKAFHLLRDCDFAHSWHSLQSLSWVGWNVPAAPPHKTLIPEQSKIKSWGQGQGSGCDPNQVFCDLFVRRFQIRGKMVFGYFV